MTDEVHDHSKCECFVISVSEESDSGDPPRPLPLLHNPKLKKNAVDQLDQTNKKKKIKKIHLFLSSIFTGFVDRYYLCSLNLNIKV
ncbi:hypothetical protein BpHYR1_025237 [Brachionus plicatilis]|uniref:Uncharacterized protein n=1 Tax=Brachionus plicatilis TaxID=10195 RepID=A0A3M7TB21_BRAPC|nr:hypothetical protein BpHYR1_025237 [Brachionus plicatilis]